MNKKHLCLLRKLAFVINCFASLWVAKYNFLDKQELSRVLYYGTHTLLLFRLCIVYLFDMSKVLTLKIQSFIC